MATGRAQVGAPHRFCCLVLAICYGHNGLALRGAGSGHGDADGPRVTDEAVSVAFGVGVEADDVTDVVQAIDDGAAHAVRVAYGLEVWPCGPGAGGTVLLLERRTWGSLSVGTKWLRCPEAPTACWGAARAAGGNAGKDGWGRTGREGPLAKVSGERRVQG